jgi:DNA-binding response OmpR family regulator
VSQVLIIEDQPQVRANISQILTLEGFETLTAADGEAGLKLATQHHPDLILCDIMMPSVSGYQVVKRLREQPDTLDIPFIFLTAKAKREDLRQGMDLGADDYITKPFTPQELLQAIRSRLDRQTNQQQAYTQKIDQLTKAITESIPIEIQTPLKNIVEMSGVMRSHYGSIDPREMVRMLSEIEDCSHHLDRLVSNFLIHARLEVALKNSEAIAAWQDQGYHCDIKPIITKLAHQKARLSDRRHDVDLLNLQDCQVALPAAHFTKAMEEILDNAFKFSPPGTPIHMVSQPSGDAVYCYILNHGQGMSASQIAAIGPYMQFNSTPPTQTGIGLGLTIAKQIVTFHGGTLEVKSIAGKQTIIRILLPKVPTPAQEEPLVTPEAV